MKLIRPIVIICLIIQLLTSASCAADPSPYAYDYPRGLTPKYCFENYFAFDPNIRYTECYEFVVPWNRTERKRTFMGSVEFSAIKDADDLSFMVAYKTIHWFGENRWISVVRHRDCDIDPIMDYTPSKIELCTYDDLMCHNAYIMDVEESPETYYSYAENTFSEPIVTIGSPEAIGEVMAVAQRPATMTTEENFRESAEHPSSYKLNRVYWQEKPVYVKISFEECAGMVWVGQLLTDNEGRAYMERSAYVHAEGESYKYGALCIGDTFPSPSGKGWGYLLGENMDAILRDIMSDN